VVIRFFYGVKTKPPPSPIRRSCYPPLVPAEQIGIELLLIVGKIDMEDHVLPCLIDHFYFTLVFYPVGIDIGQHQVAPLYRCKSILESAIFNVPTHPS
jgi:hypothetical protein